MMGGMKVEEAMRFFPPERGFNLKPPRLLQLQTYA